MRCAWCSGARVIFGRDCPFCDGTGIARPQDDGDEDTPEERRAAYVEDVVRDREAER